MCCTSIYREIWKEASGLSTNGNLPILMIEPKTLHNSPVFTASFAMEMDILLDSLLFFYMSSFFSFFCKKDVENKFALHMKCMQSATHTFDYTNNKPSSVNFAERFQPLSCTHPILTLSFTAFTHPSQSFESYIKIYPRTMHIYGGTHYIKPT